MIVNEIRRSYDFDETIEINAIYDGKPLDYRDLNELIHQALNLGYKKIILNDVCGQRFIGASLQGDIEVDINGLPGNDLGIFMDGPTIVVKGNCEDQSGNTMNNGTIIIDGSGGDVLGFSSRGGKIFVKENVGYRVGIHMKEYQNHFPVMIIGGTTKDFLGEYMAGGLIIVLGLEFFPDGSIKESEHPICGKALGTGIHRGKIILRTNEDLEERLGIGAKIVELSDQEIKVIYSYLIEFCQIFNIPLEIIKRKSFKLVKAISKRPFGGNYCSQII
jgi:glutamate synthase domain-containing protein 3